MFKKVQPISTKNRFIQLLTGIIMLSSLWACKKDSSLPMISKTFLKGVGPTYADIQGRVYVEGSSPIIQRGVCWMLKKSAGSDNSMQFPTLTNDTMSFEGSTGLANARIRGLLSDTAYFACLYARNGEGIKYSYPVLFRTPAIPEGYVFVEGGDFDMGSSSGADDENPVHLVTLGNYFISGKEINNTEYCKFLNAINLTADGRSGDMEFISMTNAHILITHDGLQFLPKSGFEDYPAVGVSWYGAKAYTNWIGGHLPTEAEWEFAARGGLQSGHFVYAGSDEPGGVAWYADNSMNQLHPGGGKAPNELGMYDMTGNVWEWCEDWYSESYYGGSAIKNPQGPSSGTQKVLRGGSWQDASKSTTSRNSETPDTSGEDIGFRVVIPIGL